MRLGELKENYGKIGVEGVGKGEGMKREYVKEMMVGEGGLLGGYEKVGGGECGGRLKGLMEWEMMSSCGC